ncbi:VPLPA-CTERM sorting domain-containing protein [Massilia sp. YMA4]|uniref:VPLPA-CTERM sorting domain-containing protein n=1 Tax=Massilia sp. YMA4 TaxID=1593482 RepID=UPI000DD14C85|nr:VPLPA-CTERM sorting domain-containing protein [Massilia sp. YMA4]AXA93267.1 hypothetical protein DPH57_20210 [Massilia sp. YMA4]
MLKKLMSAAVLAAAAATAHAAPQSYEITYRGFQAVHDGVFEPDRTLKVTFTVDDLDHNGSYSLDELLALDSNRIAYSGSCDIIHCVDIFTWTPGALPTFSARYINNNGFDFTMQSIVTGESHKSFYQSSFGFRYDYTWDWTPATTATITAVPEPASFGMLAVGLAGMVALGRRRRAHG